MYVFKFVLKFPVIEGTCIFILAFVLKDIRILKINLSSFCVYLVSIPLLPFSF